MTVMAALMVVTIVTLLSLSHPDPARGAPNPYLPTPTFDSNKGKVITKRGNVNFNLLEHNPSAATSLASIPFADRSKGLQPAAQPEDFVLQKLPVVSSYRGNQSLSPSFREPSVLSADRQQLQTDTAYAGRKVQGAVRDLNGNQQAQEASVSREYAYPDPGSRGSQRLTRKDPVNDRLAAASPIQSPPGRQSRCLVLEDPEPCGGGGGREGQSGFASRRNWRHGVTLPNLYGHYTVEQALTELRSVLSSTLGGPRGGYGWTRASSNYAADTVIPFMCSLYLPPCDIAPFHDGMDVSVGQEDFFARGSLPAPTLPLPCRPLCELARLEVQQQQQQQQSGDVWPSNIHCHTFPTERCYALAGLGEVKYVSKALTASGTGARMHDVIPQSVATLESELGDEDPFDIQVMTIGTNQIPPRRYDINDLGDPSYFHGWADVQGTGAANDYCRVIGKGKRRFLSCALAGTRGQDHVYVSKLGFEPGHPGTWFMRDVDSDGRDDYCRCTGEEAWSRVVCMKAGEKGFYGSTVQGGSQTTFELPRSQGCHHKHFNPHFGL